MQLVSIAQSSHVTVEADVARLVDGLLSPSTVIGHCSTQLATASQLAVPVEDLSTFASRSAAFQLWLHRFNRQSFEHSIVHFSQLKDLRCYIERARHDEPPTKMRLVEQNVVRSHLRLHDQKQQEIVPSIVAVLDIMKQFLKAGRSTEAVKLLQSEQGSAMLVRVKDKNVVFRCT